MKGCRGAFGGVAEGRNWFVVCEKTRKGWLENEENESGGGDELTASDVFSDLG